MGRAVIEMAADDAEFEVAAVFGRPSATGRVHAPGAVASVDEALATCEVIVDFSTASASAELAERAASRGGPALVLGATGQSDAERDTVERAARRIAIVQSVNFSIGVNALAGLVEQAARRLPAAEWDIEIVEAHHRRKRDAPSGTALMLGAAAARGRRVRLADSISPARDGGTAARRTGDIGFAVIRGGGIVGEHSVVFAGDQEILSLSHSARDRSLFARGALVAARWVAGRTPGLYDMIDVLGFRT
jgi:4-hydroxy-tetrahydrodipicolinate reductase